MFIEYIFYNCLIKLSFSENENKYLGILKKPWKCFKMNIYVYFVF